MPRIPISRGASGRPSTAGLKNPREAALPLEIVANTFAGLTEATSRLRAEEISAARGVLYSQKQAELVSRLGELRNSLAESDDIDSIVSDFDSGAQDIYNEIKGTISDERVASAFDRFAVKDLASGHVSSLQLQRRRRSEQAKAELPEILQQYEDAILDASSEDERRMLIQSGHEAIELRSPYLTAETRAQMREHFDQSVDMNRASKIIDESPERLLRISSDREEFKGFFPSLDEKQRVQIRNAAETAINRAETDARDARREAEKASALDMIDRIFNPENPSGFPTMIDVMDSTLSPEHKEHFAKIVQEHGSGKDVNREDHILVNDLYRRIHDENSPEHITDFSELIPYIGNGLPFKRAEEFRTDIDSYKNPDTKMEQKLLADFFKAAKAQISGSTLFGKDSVGEAKFYEFRVEAQKLFDKGVSEGKDPHDLLDPTKPDFIGRILHLYQRTPFEIQKDMAAEFGGQRYDWSTQQTEVPVDQRWIPGETAEQWRQRVEGKK